ncbi:MAG TPA: NAD synthetase, partial [Acidobacteria bacterium]|nr:NAD synthetase [Acidobacteriota bacterium]
RPVTYPGQNAVNLALLGIAVLAGIGLILRPEELSYLFPVVIVLSLVFGVLLIIPIGGA